MKKLLDKFEQVLNNEIFQRKLDKSSYLYSIFMKLEQFLHEKLLKNDVFKENLVKFGNHVETKLLEPVL